LIPPIHLPAFTRFLQRKKAKKPLFSRKRRKALKSPNPLLFSILEIT
jgi:hypothetical protein